MKKQQDGKKGSSRPCPQCKSKKTERIGEFAICLKCTEPFHHSPQDETILEPEPLERAERELDDGVGGTFCEVDSILK